MFHDAFTMFQRVRSFTTFHSVWDISWNVLSLTRSISRILWHLVASCGILWHLACPQQPSTALNSSFGWPHVSVFHQIHANSRRSILLHQAASHFRNPYIDPAAWHETSSQAAFFLLTGSTEAFAMKACLADEKLCHMACACWTHANARGSKSPHEELLNMRNDMFFMRSFPRYPRSKRLGAAISSILAVTYHVLSALSDSILDGRGNQLRPRTTGDPHGDTTWTCHDTMTRLELAVGSIWIQILHVTWAPLVTWASIPGPSWSQSWNRCDMLWQSWAPYYTIFYMLLCHWHPVVSLSFSNTWSDSFTMCMHIPSHSRPFYKSTSIAHRLFLPIWASILGLLAPFGTMCLLIKPAFLRQNYTHCLRCISDLLGEPLRWARGCLEPRALCTWCLTARIMFRHAVWLRKQ